MEIIKPNFNFKVLGDVFLSPTDLQSLTLLYQPIIGVDAFSLYFLFLTLPVATEQKHHLLLQITGGGMDHLVESRHRLEAAGLLDVYTSEDLMTYVLKSPLSAQQFFNDAIMRAFLYVKIGVQDFNALKNMLVSTADSARGDKSTKRFDEVFDVRARALSIFDPNMQFDHHIKKVEKGIKLAQVFDSSMLTSILVRKGIAEKIITPDLLKVLNDLSFLYKFNEHELARLVFDALIPDGTVDIVRMKYLARTQFQLTSKGESVQVVVKEKQIGIEKPANENSEQRMIAYIENDPINFLTFKSGGKPPVPADMKLVEWLYIDQGMPAGVVNVLIDYVLNYTDGNLPKQLIEKIAGQWQRQGVNTTGAAMDKVRKSLAKRSQYQKEKQKPIANQPRNLKNVTRAEPIPEWLDKINHDQDGGDLAAKERVEKMKQMMLAGGVENAETQ